MKGPLREIAMLFACAAFGAVAVTGQSSKQQDTANQTITLPQVPPETLPGPHLDTYRKDCLTCHSGRYVTMQPRFSRTVWENEVKKMVTAYGAQVPEAEQREIVDYLTAVRGAESK